MEIRILKAASVGWTTSLPHYPLPKNGGFKKLTPGESWYRKNILKGSTPPRGKVYKRGKQRFEARTWQKTEGGRMEFLPAT
ncbi:hypothetical protein [Teredinibacter purpureus]|uniref:hypothetical protein n=1 Tax=Teredinibacter purpureus TaxID=2731756 RepID=UPI0005F852B1|nr:hypothetical protein [Teredinibacter purpureus]